MPEENISWNDRNKVLKVIKANGKYGWLHLVIAERKLDGKKVLRLRKFRNWFSIPSQKYLRLIQKMLIKGSEELGWDTNGKTEPIKIIDVTKEKFDFHEFDFLDTIPEEFLEFIQDNPKAAVKLISAVDINKLDDEDVDYLRQIIEVLNKTILQASKKLKVSFQDLLEKITKEDKEGMDKLSDLMSTWSLFQIASLTNLIKERLDIIEMFENVIHDEKTYELQSKNSIHRILEKSMWLLDDEYWLVQSNKSLRRFIGDELEKLDKKYKNKRPDFVCVQAGKKLIIVEIKRPSLELGKKELDQIELYLRLIKKYKGENYSPIEAYLIGKKISQEAREILEFRRGIKLLTYQDLIESTRNRYQEFLKIIETPK